VEQNTSFAHSPGLYTNRFLQLKDRSIAPIVTSLVRKVVLMILGLSAMTDAHRYVIVF
jgi:hypothetical protein